MEGDKSKWLWGSLGFLAGTGLAWWLLKKRESAQSQAVPGLPSQVSAQTTGVGVNAQLGQPPEANQIMTGAPRSVPGGDAESEGSDYTENGEF
jgi:hypothetical protein